MAEATAPQEWVLLSPDRLFAALPETDLTVVTPAVSRAASPAPPPPAASLPHALGGGEAGRILAVLDRCARVRPAPASCATRANASGAVAATRQHWRDAA